MFRFHIESKTDSLVEIGRLLKTARKGLALTQEQVADMAGISRPRYRDIEAGSSAARTTTLINIARALGLELMLIPQAMIPAVDALLQPHDDDDDIPAFIASPDGGTDA
ncbi:helix-turn-helix domain-containing protein [Phyllobacterium sp. K27]